MKTKGGQERVVDGVVDSARRRIGVRECAQGGGEEGLAEGRSDRRTKDLAFAVLLRSKKEGYRMRYYLSSEKLKAVD